MSLSHSCFSAASNSSDIAIVRNEHTLRIHVPSACRFVCLNRDPLPSANVEVHRSRPTFGRLARLVRPLAARRSCCSAAAVYGVAGVTSLAGMAAATVRYATGHKQSRTRRGMLQPPSTLRHLPFSPRPRHAGCDAPRRAAPRMRRPACAFPGSDEGGSCAARAADAPCGAQHTMRRISHNVSCTAQHATCDRQHSAPCCSRRARHVQAARVRLCTHRHSHGSPGLPAVCARVQACMRT
jgi:hypothetical protein